jgi:hypothetical protein
MTKLILCHTYWMLSIRYHWHSFCRTRWWRPLSLSIQHIIWRMFPIFGRALIESFLIGLVNAKANFTVIACICDHESFKSLFITVSKSIFVTKIRFEFGQYMEWKGEVPFQSMSLLNNFVLMYVYLFPCKIGTNVVIDILASKKLSTLIKSPIFVFLEDW